jgi:hypothetical protein
MSNTASSATIRDPFLDVVARWPEVLLDVTVGDDVWSTEDALVESALLIRVCREDTSAKRDKVATIALVSSWAASEGRAAVLESWGATGAADETPLTTDLT